MRSWILGGVVLLGAACGGSSESSDGSGGAGSGAGSSSGGQQCYSVAVNKTNDGSSACGPQKCSGGDYCFSSVGQCDPGCLSELNCPGGQTCDLSNATPDLQDRPIGLCRAPNASETIPCGSSSGSAMSTASGGSDCQSRCETKAASCDAPPTVSTPKCEALCSKATPDQVTCIEGTSCQELGDAFEQGTPICGLSL